MIRIAVEMGSREAFVVPDAPQKKWACAAAKDDLLNADD